MTSKVQPALALLNRFKISGLGYYLPIASQNEVHQGRNECRIELARLYMYANLIVHRLVL